MWVKINKIGFNYINKKEILKYKTRWFPLNKGGEYKKWFGNTEWVIDLENEGERIKKSGKNYRLRDSSFYFKQGITWSEVSSSKISFRYSENGYLFGSTGPMIFSKIEDNLNLLNIISFLNTNIIQDIANLINPTLHYNVGTVSMFPFASKIKQLK